MKYGPVKLDDALGAILAHSFKPAKGKPVKKGTVLGESEIALLRENGVDPVLAAVIGPGDIGEDAAATRIGAALASNRIRAEDAATGRVNLYATVSGLFRANRELVDRLNRIDPGITLATLDDYAEVNDGRLVATVKIIPYAVNEKSVAMVEELAGEGPIDLAPYSAMRVGVVATRLPQLKPSVMDKTIRVLEQRLDISGSRISGEIRTGHSAGEIAAALERLRAGSDILLVYGASAICDIDDVIPAAIRQLGGRIEHFGMPVDPGNLLLVGEIEGKPVIGAPGCARSPAENGFDWVLRRFIAGTGIEAEEITGMGVGGLLMEVGARPQPREKKKSAGGKTAAVILAAGQSRRMGKTNKLTAVVDGEAMVKRAVRAAVASRADPVIVVTGHEREEVEGEIAEFDVRTIHNADYAEGLSASLAAGIGAVGSECDSAIVLLGDMPLVDAGMIDRMIETAANSPADSIILATFNGKRGNPVLWPRSYFDRLKLISGDVGARHVIGEHADRVVTVELGEAAGFDVDTPEALARAAGKPGRKY